MRHHFSRRVFLAGLSTALTGAAWAGAPARSLRPQARPASLVTPRSQGRAGGASLIAKAGLPGAVGYAVADARTGLGLESIRGDADLPPASVAKAITALYALETLGADHRFETSVIATGQITAGVLDGDLILAGGGDPTLDTDGLAALAAQVKSAGISKVKGRFLVWGGALPFVKAIDPGQPDHVGYNPSISGLTLNFNRVHFEWKRGSEGYAISMDARSETHRPVVKVAGMSVVNRKLPVYTYRDQGGRDVWTVAKAALNKYGSRWLPVRKPEIYAGEAFRELAKAQGVGLPEPKVTRSLPKGAVVARRRSEPLSRLLTGMLKYSTNITAEMIGLAATAARREPGGTLRKSAASMSTWARQRLGMSKVKLVDHSGLGGASRVRASEMAAALANPRVAGLLKPLLKPIPMRTPKGKIDKAHPIKVAAKTGTLNFVSGLAGYMTAPDGTDLAFAIFAADLKARGAVKQGDMERPHGARAWNKKAKTLQQALIERWGAVYGS